MIKLLAALAIVAFATTIVARAGDEAPPWLQQAASVTSPTYDQDVPAVVLRNEQTVTVDSEGKVTTVSRYAIRVLTREGRRFATAAEGYLTKAGKVKDLRAWLIRSNVHTAARSVPPLVSHLSQTHWGNGLPLRFANLAGVAGFKSRLRSSIITGWI